MSCEITSTVSLLTFVARRPVTLRWLQGKEGPKTPLSDVITILPPKEEITLEVTPNFG